MKKDGSVCICVHLKKLYQSVLCERYILLTVDELLPKLTGAKVFSSLDAASGFWAIPLDNESAKLTTFITPFSHYHFKRLPFGISSAPEIFQRKMHDILKGLPGAILYGFTHEEHDENLKS
jgi:hypothetical protein